MSRNLDDEEERRAHIMGVVNVAGDSTKNQSFAGGSFAPKAEGWYDVRIDSTQDWAGDGSKPPAVILKCQIVKSDLNPPVHVGEPISNFMSLDKKQAGRWRSLLDQTNVEYRTTQNPDGTEGVLFDTDHLPGRFLRVKIKHNAGSGKNAGKTFENWDEIAVSQFNPQPSAQGQYMQQPPAGQPQYAQQPPQQTAPQGALPTHPGQGQMPPQHGR